MPSAKVQTLKFLMFCLNPWSLVALLLLLPIAATMGQVPASAIDWPLTSLESIGGRKPTLVGSPKLSQEAPNQAIDFDGSSALFLNTNPLTGLENFTAEVIFRPASTGAAEQRFVHFQEAGTDNRLLFELRLIEGNRWFLDTFIKSGAGNYTQFAEKFPHPIGPWYHAAVTMDGQTMRHYVNATEEMSTAVTYAPQKAGQTSIGVRINKVSWYTGSISRVRVTPRVLKPDEFLKP